MRLLLACLVGFVLLASSGRSSRAHAFNEHAAPDTVRLSLEETIARTLNRSPEVGVEEAQRRRAAARYGEARASRFLTEFSLNTAHSFAPGLDIPPGNTQPLDQLYLNPEVDNDWTLGALRPFNQLEVKATQPLYTWGELSGSIRAARFGVQVDAAAVERKALEVALRTGRLYYDLQLTQELQRLANETESVIDRAAREMQRLIKAGSTSVDLADEYQLKLFRQEYQRRVVEIREQQATARAALQRQLFLSDTTAFAPAAGPLQPLNVSIAPDALQHYITMALRRRPEINQAQAGIQARKAQVTVARSDYYPKLGLQASYTIRGTPGRYRQENAYINDPYRGQGTRTGIGIQQNLNFFQTEARVEQAQAQLAAVRYQLDGARQLVKFETEEAFRKLLIAQAALKSRRASLDLTKEWLRTEQINFDLGVGNVDNLVQAVQANLDAEVRYWQAVRDFNVAVLRLYRATGVLVDRTKSGMLVEPNP
ncbi:TolC family protein [Salisaeta longa]|uniref:TolC family protein n=1 Tax=Salisaeta longa TaxID=503170 RepID=UPI0003B49952|nr:TolC family protein [Salisaeta longa]